MKEIKIDKVKFLSFGFFHISFIEKVNPSKENSPSTVKRPIVQRPAEPGSPLHESFIGKNGKQPI